MWNQKPSFRFEIDNFSEKKAKVSSKTFVCGGCRWYLTLYPKGDRAADNHLSLFLHVANPQLLPTGWKRITNFYFVLLNQSDEELRRSITVKEDNPFCAANPSLGFPKLLPLSKFQDKGFLENDRLIIDVYIKIVEAVGLEGGEGSDKKKTVIINGFQVFGSQVISLRKIFIEHPGIAEDFKPTNQAVKDAYMNVLLKLVKTLQKPPKSLSETRLQEACSQISELTNVGFNLDWLKFKLEEVSLERKKSDADVSRVQQLEERVKNLELMELSFKLDSLNTKLDKISLLRKKSDDADESRAQQLDERVKNLELMELGFKLDSLNTKLDEVCLERKKSNDADESRAQQLDERVRNLELMELGFKLDSLNTKLDEVSLERKKSNDADESRAQQLDERIKNLELMDLDFKLDSLNTKLNTKLDEVSLERRKSDDADESRAQQLEERVNNLELMDLGFKLNCLNTKLDELSLDRKKSYDAVESRVQQFEDAVESRVQQFEECVWDLRFKLDNLNTKLEEISLESMKTDDADGSPVQQLEESVKNIELMVSHLRVELDKKKDKSSDDGFLLVDEVD